MCLGVPGLVTEIDELTALVDFWGVRRRIRLDLVDEPVKVGDYILNHVGFAIRRIPPEDVQTTLELYEQLLRESTGSGPEDLMAADVRGEIRAGRTEAPAPRIDLEAPAAMPASRRASARAGEASASDSPEPMRGPKGPSIRAGGGAPARSNEHRAPREPNK